MEATHPAQSGLDRAVTNAAHAGRALGESRRTVGPMAGRWPSRVYLVPGDMTRYDIVLSPPAGPILQFDADGGTTAIESDEWYVSVNGVGYPWGCTTTVEGPYAAEKWSRNGNVWTGEVVAAFLTAFAHGLNGTTPAEA